MEQKTVYYISEAARKVQVESHVLRYWEEELELPIMRNEMGHRCYTEQDIRRLQEIKQLKEQGLQLKAIRTILFRLPGQEGSEGGDLLMRQLGRTIEGEERSAETSRTESKAAGTKTAEMKPAETKPEENDPAEKTAEKRPAEPEMAVGKIGDVAGKQETGKQEMTRSETESMTEQRMEQGERKTDSMTEGGQDTKGTEMDITRPQRFVVALTKEKEEVTETEREYEDTDRSRKAARLQYLLQHMITEAVKSANRELCTDVKESILKELDYQFRMQEERDEERWKREEEHYRKIDEMIRERHKPKERLGRGKKKSPAGGEPVNL